MPANRTAAKRPTLQYSALALLLIAALIYQVRFTVFRFPKWFGKRDAVAYPFLVLPDAKTLRLVTYLLVPVPGIANGEPVDAVDGRPLTGMAVFAEALKHHRPGDLLSVTVEEKKASGAPVPRVLHIRLVPGSGYISKEAQRSKLVRFANVLLLEILPAFCLFLGFWVTAIRIADPRAWLLLALMLSFAAFFNPGAESWGPWLRDYGALYHELLHDSLPIWLLLFGLYFPEPFPAGSRWALWARWKWILIAPLAVFTVLDSIGDVGAIENIASAETFLRMLQTAWSLFRWLFYGAGPILFVCLAAKFRLATSRDARRRLGLLFAGAALSLLPMLTLTIASNILNVSAEQHFPAWVNVTAYVMFFLFPLTLAYVIVVHRAMGAQVVIRQGLKYALAQRGIRVMRTVVGVTLGIYIASVANEFGKDSAIPYLIVAGGALLWFTLRRLMQGFSAWTDRHFFRDAYNAEQLLAELGETVRSIVETRPLLATVAARISQSMHVPRIAVLLDGSGPYHPAYALGYEPAPSVAFSEDAATIRQLREEREPARVYFDDPKSWVYTNAAMTEEERHRLAELQPELLLPLSAKDKLFGFISLSQKLSEEPYSPSDVRLLQSVAAQTGLALEVARLTTEIGQEIAQRERLNREVEIAREVQERLFPQELPPIEGLDYCGACRPALGVGGDYYDFLMLPGDRLGIALGDVSGKGIAAALMMASLQASLRAEASRGANDIASLIRKVNRLLFEASTANRYATFFYAQYEAATRQFTYVNAGHNPPFLLVGGCKGEVKRLETGGMVVGLLKDFPYSQDTIALEPGDLLVAYTDGISETMNAAEEEWGEENLIQTIQQCDGLGAREMIAHIMKAADGFAAGAKQHDDMTITVLRAIA